MSTAAATKSRKGGDFTLRESLSLQEGSLRDDGTVLVHIIRPGVGRGRGRHVYGADMLRENAGVFAGAKMYMNHLSDAAQKALGGLPRPIEQLGGRIIESWWDESVPADDRFGQGAVVGLARPTRFMRELIEDDPELVATSINTDATAVRPTRVDGKPALLVEGIVPPVDIEGSVDWVTAAGCGGKILAQLQESSYDSEKESDMATLETLNDDELLAHIRETRPALLEAISKDDNDDDDLENLVQKHMRKGLPRAAAEQAARKEMGGGGNNLKEGANVDGNALREALTSDEGKGVITEIVTAAVTAANEQAEARWAEREREIREAATADVRRRGELRDMAEQAARLVEATRLPSGWKDEIASQFRLLESGEATLPLNAIHADYDGDGRVIKSAAAKLTEAVQAEIGRFQKLYAEANPTRVVGAGLTAATLRESTDGGEGGEGAGGDGKDRLPNRERDEREAAVAAAAPLVESLFSESGLAKPGVKLTTVW